MCLRSKVLGAEQPGVGHPAPATWGRLCQPSSSHLSRGIHPRHRNKARPRAAEEIAPPMPLHLHSPIQGPSQSPEAPGACLSPPSSPPSWERPRQPAGTRTNTSQLLQHPQHLHIEAPRATPPHLEMGDGHTHRYSTAALQALALSVGWGNDAVTVTRGYSIGHFVQ